MIAEQDTQGTYNVTLWHICIMFASPQLSYHPDISLEESTCMVIYVASNNKMYSWVYVSKVPKMFALFYPNLKLINRFS
jgi:hypothetical protein